MNVRLLALSRDVDFLEHLHESSTNFDVQVSIVLNPKKAWEIARRKFDILAVDKWYLGNARNAAALIRSIRRLGDTRPIVAVDIAYGDGTPFSMQVAGCNFVLDALGKWRPQLSREYNFAYGLLELAENISEELGIPQLLQKKAQIQAVA